MPQRGGDPRRKAPLSADKDSPDFWRGVKSGDFVGISDAEAFAASLAAGEGSGVDYVVGDVRSFALRGAEPHTGLGTYGFIELRQEGSGPLYLALVDLPERFELRLYFIPAGLEPGTRDDFIDRGDTWLFLPPPNPDDFISSELEYAPYPDVPEIEGRKLPFSRIGPGSLYGESLDTRSPVIITEYSAASPEGIPGGSPTGEPEPANPLLLVLEEGWMRSDGAQPEEGGYLTAMLGKVLRPGDVEHYPS